MTRKTIDCRTVPNDVGCTLSISGEPDELVTAAAQHAVSVHGHADTPQLREQLRGVLAESPQHRRRERSSSSSSSTPTASTNGTRSSTGGPPPSAPSGPHGGPSSAPTVTGPGATSRWWSSPATPRRWPTPATRPPQRFSRNCSRSAAASRSTATWTCEARGPTDRRNGPAAGHLTSPQAASRPPPALLPSGADARQVTSRETSEEQAPGREERNDDRRNGSPAGSGRIQRHDSR